MRHATGPHRSRSRIAIGIGLTLLAVFGLLGLVVNTPQRSGSAVNVTGTPGPGAGTHADWVGAGDKPATTGQTGPVAAARTIATGLLTWDTTTGRSPTADLGDIIAAADPTGVETPGLLADLANYRPSPQQWQTLTTHQVSQTVTITDAAIPKAWADIVASADAALPAYTTAVTIQAVRHRRGMAGGQPHATDHPLTFTMFLACPATTEACHLLRLSVPGTTLY